MLEKNPTLVQAEVEAILKDTALALKSSGSQTVILPLEGLPLPPGEYTFSWDTDCFGHPCDAVGAGLIQADDALAATPDP